MTADPRNQLAQALGRSLNDPLLDQLLRLLSDLLEKDATQTEASEQLANDPTLSEVQSLISFAGAKVKGGVRIRDVAGHDIVNLNITLLSTHQFEDRERRNQFARDYANEVHQRFQYWRHHYIALSSQASTLVANSNQLSVTSMPSYFRPRGYRVTYREPLPSESGKKRESNPKYFDDVCVAVAEVGDAVLLGEPGAGKTTSLWRLMLDYADKAADDPNALLPVLVPLGGYDGQSNILEFIRRQLAETFLEGDDGQHRLLPRHQWLADQLEDELVHRRLALFFDGLNEVPADFYTSTLTRLATFRRNYPGNRTLVTCREVDYIIGLPVAEIYIKPLDDDDIRDFIQVYLPDRAKTLIDKLQDESRSLWEMGRNPYLLHMMITIYHESGTLPINQAELFGEFVGALLLREYFTHPDRWQVSRRRPVSSVQAQLRSTLLTGWRLLRNWDIHPEDYGLEGLSEHERQTLIVQAGITLLALAQLAYDMSATGDRGTIVTKVFVAQHLHSQVRLDRYKVSLNPDRLLYLAQSASLLEPMPEGFRFSHQLLQEYFTAVHLNTLDPGNPKLLKCLQDDTWDETVKLLAGMTQHPDQLVMHLLLLDPFLAARCADLQSDSLSITVTNSLVEIMTSLACDTYSPWQEGIIDTLGTMSLPTTVAILLRATHNQFADSRCAAIKALQVRGVREAIPMLQECLQDKDRTVRQAAIEALQNLGARQAIPTLIERLSDEDKDVSEAAALALGKLGVQEAVPYLVKWLRSYDDVLHELFGRRDVAEVLEELWNRADTTTLIGWLQDESKEVRKVAAKVLARRRAQEAVPSLLERLQDKDEDLQSIAAKTLGTLGAVPVLMELLQNKNKDVSWAAARALAILGMSEGLPLLTEQLEDNDWSVRRAAVQALTTLGVPAVVPLLIERLDDNDWFVRSVSIRGLLTLKVQKVLPRYVFPALVERLREKENRADPTDILKILEGLWSHDDIPDLLTWLRDKDRFVRQAAINGLVELNARNVIPTLINQLKDEEWFVQYGAAKTLEKLWTQEDFTDLLNWLRNEHPAVCRTAVQAIVKFEVQEAVPILIERLEGNDWQVREVMVSALGDLGAQKAIPDLITRLQHDDSTFVRQTVARTLGELKAHQAISVLRNCMEHEEEGMRWTAVQALGKLGAQEAIPDLIMRLQHDDIWAVRRITAWALGELKAREAIPILVDWLREEHADTYDRAAEALNKLWTRDDIPDLLNLLRKEPLEVQLPVAQTLGALGQHEVILSTEALETSEVQEVISILVIWLQHDYKDMDVVAARTLGALGARQVIPALLKMLQDSNKDRHEAAALALERLWTKNDIPVLIELLRSKESNTPQAVAKILEKFEAREAAPALILLTFDGNSKAADLLVNLAPRAILPILGHLLAHPEGWVRWSAIALSEEIRRKGGLPRNPQLIQSQVSNLQRSGQTLSARTALQAVVTLSNEALTMIPSWILALRYKAEALRRLGYPSAALATLETNGVDTNDRQYVVYILEQARCQQVLRRQSKALALLRRIISEAGDNSSILTDCAHLLEDLGITEEADGLYTQLISNGVSYLCNRAGFYIRQARYAEAEEDIKRATKDEPWHLDTLILQGQLALVRRRFAEALLSYQEVVLRDPHGLWGYSIAFAHFGLNQIKQGMILLEQVLARTDLHEQAQAALEGLEMLARVEPDLVGLEEAQQRILATKALLDKMLEENWLESDTNNTRSSLISLEGIEGV